MRVVLHVTLAVVAASSCCCGRTSAFCPSIQRASSDRHVRRGAADDGNEDPGDAPPVAKDVDGLQREVISHMSTHLRRMDAVKQGLMDDGYAERGSVGSGNGDIPKGLAWGGSRERKERMVASFEKSAQAYRQDQQLSEVQDAEVLPDHPDEASPMAQVLQSTARAAAVGVAEDGIGSSSRHDDWSAGRDRDGSWTDEKERKKLLAALDALDGHVERTVQWDSRLAVEAASFLSWSTQSPAPLLVPLDVPGAPPNAKVHLQTIPAGSVLSARPTPPGAVGFTKVLHGSCTVISGIGSDDRRREINRKAVTAPAPAWQSMGGPWRQLVAGDFPEARSGPLGVITRQIDEEADGSLNSSGEEAGQDDSWQPSNFASTTQIEQAAAAKAEAAKKPAVVLHIQLTPPNRDYPVAVGGSFSDVLEPAKRKSNATATFADGISADTARVEDPHCAPLCVLPGASSRVEAGFFATIPPPPEPSPRVPAAAQATPKAGGAGTPWQPEPKKTYSLKFSSSNPSSFFAPKPKASAGDTLHAPANTDPAVPLGEESAQAPLKPSSSGTVGSFGALSNPEALRAVGGLDAQIKTIARRIFATRRLAAGKASALGLGHVRGLLLHGPPGCGKTLMARQLAQAVDAVECQVVSGPEVLNKFVGTSEERVRQLFAGAEQDWRANGAKSGLHVIILDELDAICRQRGSLGGDTSGVRDSVVNQLLAKLDGVTELGNILVIGLTNQRALIDDAMLRPGRLEVHVYVGKPDLEGRQEILNIHTAKLEAEGCITPEAVAYLPTLAEQTDSLSGAELAGVVRAAASYALERVFDQAEGGGVADDAQIHVDVDDFQRALEDRSRQKVLEAEEDKALREGRLLGEQEAPTLKVDSVAVTGFLKSVGLEQYASLFEEQQIGPDEFSMLDHHMLEAVGVTLLGHRLRILNAIPKPANAYATTRRR